MTADVALALELFGPLGAVRTRRMFGALGVFRDDAMFALIHRGVVHVRARDALARRFEAAGAKQFTYERDGRTVALGYWSLPESALDDPDEALDWAREALAQAR